MSEKVNENLLNTEYDSVGALLLDLIKSCPFLPAQLQEKENGVMYQLLSDEQCVCIVTRPGDKRFKRNVQGSSTAQIKFQIAYKSLPTTNAHHLDAQTTVDNMTAWLETINNYPQLTKGRKITAITASYSYAATDEYYKNNGTVYVADAILEYESESEE